MPPSLHVVFDCFNFALFSLLLLANNNLWRFVSPFGLSQGLACSQVAVIIRISCDSFCLEHWFKHAWVCGVVQEQESERAHPRFQPLFVYRFMVLCQGATLHETKSYALVGFQTELKKMDFTTRLQTLQTQVTWMPHRTSDQIHNHFNKPQSGFHNR